MQTPEHSAVRLLHWMMALSVVAPISLFFYSSWLNYRTTHAVADERVERSADVVYEHALKVFETVDRSLAEVQEIIRDMSDVQIEADEQRLHGRLEQLADALPQVKSIWVVDRHGRPLASSLEYPLDKGLDFSDREYFQSLITSNAGTHISTVLTPRTFGGANFFNVSRRRPTNDGTFNGAILISVLPEYFQDFYTRIGRSPGSFYALVRADGFLLARYPAPKSYVVPSPMRDRLVQMLAQSAESKPITWVSEVDNLQRRIVYRKLGNFPIYLLAGTEASAIEAEWIETVRNHLIFGVPTILVLCGIIGIALKRTRRMYSESERRIAAEEALRQAQRLEAIGQLTGGVAHDFNNLLMIINGSIQRLRRDLIGEKYIRLLDIVATATRRGESLTRQLLTFSRRQMLTPVVVDLTQRLPELKDILNRSLRGDIDIKVNVADAVCAAKIDPSELELAILNLAVNARDAMENGGTLTLAVHPVTLDGSAATDGLRGDFIAIAMTDTGSGIPEWILPRIFEPFFTTKEIGRGTGLGLSQVYGFAKQSGGTVTVSSSLGVGTTFTLYLPRSHEKPEPSDQTVLVEASASAAGKVLVVEDNIDVRDVTVSYLEQLGYQVETAANARSALVILASNKTIDLVFSDILMPGGVSGLDLASIIRQRYPYLPVLLTTGYSNNALEKAKLGFPILQKPYDIAALKKTLREVMGASSQKPPARAAS